MSGLVLQWEGPTGEPAPLAVVVGPPGPSTAEALAAAEAAATSALEAGGGAQTATEKADEAAASEAAALASKVAAAASEFVAGTKAIEADASAVAADASKGIATDAAITAAALKQDVIALGSAAGSYTTLALANAALGSIAADHGVYVTADGSNNGFWVKRSGALVRESTATLPSIDQRAPDIITALKYNGADVIAGFFDPFYRSALFVLDDAEKTVINPFITRIARIATEGQAAAQNFSVIDNPAYAFAIADVAGYSPFAIGSAARNFKIDNPWLDSQIARIDTIDTPKRLFRLGSDGDSRDDFNAAGRTFNVHGWLYWALMRWGDRFRSDPDWSVGVFGNRTSDMLARVEATAALPVDAIFVLISTNNWNSPSNLLAAAKSDIEAYIDRIVNKAKKKLGFLAEFPRGPALELTGQQLQRLLGMNRYFIGLRDNAGIYAFDTFSRAVDPTSATALAKPGMLRDDIHEAPLGAKTMTDPMASFFETLPACNILVSTNADRFDAEANPEGNHVPNGMLFGDTGTKGFNVTVDADSKVADNWSLASIPGVTVKPTKRTDDDGNVYQWLTISGTPSSSTNLDITLSATINAADINPGDVLEVLAWTEVDEGAVGYRAVQSNVVMLYPTLPQDGATCGGHNTDVVGPSIAYGGYLPAPRCTVAAEQPTTVLVRLRIRAIFGVPIAISCGFRNASLRKVIE